jgi:hypothetical protein
MKSESYEGLRRKLDTYASWKHCIVELCEIPLTKAYIEKRITQLKDNGNEHTKKFVMTWGEGHLNKVIWWFEQAQKEV